MTGRRRLAGSISQPRDEFPDMEAGFAPLPPGVPGASTHLALRNITRLDYTTSLLPLLSDVLPWRSIYIIGNKDLNAGGSPAMATALVGVARGGDDLQDWLPSSWWFAKQRLFDRTTMMRRVPLEMGDCVFFSTSHACCSELSNKARPSQIAPMYVSKSSTKKEEEKGPAASHQGTNSSHSA